MTRETVLTGIAILAIYGMTGAKPAIPSMGGFTDRVAVDRTSTVTSQQPQIAGSVVAQTRFSIQPNQRAAS